MNSNSSTNTLKQESANLGSLQQHVEWAAQHADLSKNGLSGFRSDIDLRKLQERPLGALTSIRFDSNL